MRLRQVLIAAAAAAGLAGCAAQPGGAPGAGGAPPAADTVVVEPPGPGVPEAVAAFSGRWSGPWRDGAEGALAVARVAPDGAAEALFLPDGEGGPAYRVQGAIHRGALALDPSEAGPAVFVLQPDGSLEVTWSRDGRIRRGAFRPPAS